MDDFQCQTYWVALLAAEEHCIRSLMFTIGRTVDPEIKQRGMMFPGLVTFTQILNAMGHVWSKFTQDEQGVPLLALVAKRLSKPHDLIMSSTKVFHSAFDMPKS